MSGQRSFWEEQFPRELDRPPIPLLSPLASLAELRGPAEVLRRLQAIDWSFTQDDTGYLGHDLHPYPAKFIPQLPANLITALTMPGELVWDPFGGSGTTALEALLLGRRAISTDISPLATLIAEAKCTALSPEERDELQRLLGGLHTLSSATDLEVLLRSDWPRVSRFVPEIPNIENWFCDTAIKELAYIRAEIEDLRDEVTRKFAKVALSAIVLGVSNQDGETRYARRIKKLDPGRTTSAFCRALSSALAKHEPMEALLGYRRAIAGTLDARTIPEEFADLAPESVDLIVTSPPYANATDYHLYHRFRLFWLGHDPRTLAQDEIGSHLRHQREERGFDLYEQDLAAALGQMAVRLRTGRYAVLIVGDSVFAGETLHTVDALGQVARGVGLELVGSVSRPVHATRRSFISAARRTRSEDILLLRRPPRRLEVVFRPAPYRLWDYEETLRKREITSLLGVRTEARKGALTARLDPYQVDRAQRLVFSHAIEGPGGRPRWRTWQSVLENGDATASRKNPKYVTHGIHAYKGKFYPQLAKALLNLAGASPGALVLDPFCGSGTVLLEAQLNGMSSVGCDLNPLAALISRAKTAVATESAVVLDRTLKEFADRVAVDRSSEGDISYFRLELRPEIERWFPAPVIRRLGWVLSKVEHVPNSTARLVLQVLLSSLVREVSQQEPADLRIRRRKAQLMDAPVLESLQNRISLFRTRIQQFGDRSSAAPVSFPPATVIEGDARSWDIFSPYEDRVACVITSPPYATALPYIDTDRLSLLVVLGIEGSRRSRLENTLTGSREIRGDQRGVLETLIDSKTFGENLGSLTAVRLVRRIHRLNTSSNKVGFRRRNMAALLLRYFSDMRRVLENLARVVVPGGSLSFVIGDNRTVAGGEDVAIVSGTVLVEMARHLGWRLEEKIPISVTKEGLLHSKHSITENVVLRFHKP